MRDSHAPSSVKNGRGGGRKEEVGDNAGPRPRPTSKDRCNLGGLRA